MTRKYTINNTHYRITITDHAQQRIIDRSIPADHIVSSILTMLRDNTITRMAKYIMLKNLTQNFSLVLYCSNNHIKLITALDKISCYAKAGTNIITI